MPQGYLKGFTEGSSRFFHELRKKDLRIKKKPINHVCYSTNFYDISDEPILKQFSIRQRYLEDSFNYEKVLPPLLSSIQNRALYISRKEFEVIVEAYVSMKHRTPYYRGKVEELQKEGKVLDEVVNNVKKEIGWLLSLEPTFDYDKFTSNFKKEIRQDIDWAKKSHHRSLVENTFQINEPVRDAITKILSMNISVLEILKPKDYFFVSDNPGYSISTNKVFNTNYGNFDMIYFPINSKQVLLLHAFDPLNYVRPLIRLKYIKVPSQAVYQINRATYDVATQAVFCGCKAYLERFKSEL